MGAEQKNIVTVVKMNLGQKNSFCKYPGKLITIGTISITLYWLSMIGMATYSYYHYSTNIEQNYER